MKKLLACLSLVALTASAAESAQGDKFYVRGDLGLARTVVAVKNKTKPLYNVGFGYKFDDNVRTDLNLQFVSFGKKGAKFAAKTMMLNGYYDFTNESIVTPYVTAGFGFSRAHSEGNETQLSGGKKSVKINTKNTNSFAWNTGVGSRVAISNNVDFDIAYKFVTLGKTFDKHQARAHQITTGLAYKF